MSGRIPGIIPARITDHWLKSQPVSQKHACAESPRFQGIGAKPILWSLAMAAAMGGLAVSTPQKLQAQPAAKAEKEDAVQTCIDQMKDKNPTSQLHECQALMKSLSQALKDNKQVSSEQLEGLNRLVGAHWFISPLSTANSNYTPKEFLDYETTRLDLQLCMAERMKQLPEKEASRLLTRLTEQIRAQITPYPEYPMARKWAKAYAHLQLRDLPLEKINRDLRDVYTQNTEILLLLTGGKDLIGKAIEKSLTTFRDDKADLGDSYRAGDTLLSTQTLLLGALEAPTTSSELERMKRELRSWAMESLHTPLAEALRQKLPYIKDGHLLMRNIIAKGILVEGPSLTEAGIRRLGLSQSTALGFAPDMSDDKRYGNVGPFGRLLIDFDRVVFTADSRVYESQTDPTKAIDPAELMNFNRNAVTTYLGIIRYLMTINPDEDIQYLCGLMEHRFKTALLSDAYRLSQSPDPQIWGEHAGLYLSKINNKPPHLSEEQYLESKIDVLEKFLIKGTHQFGTPDSPQEGAFKLYRWNQQYWLLVEKGVKDPHQNPDKAQEWIEKPEFQKELDKRVEQGWQAFEKGLWFSTSGSRANQLLERLGRQPK